MFSRALTHKKSLSRSLVAAKKHGREYKGAFSGNLSSGIFGDFLTGADDAQWLLVQGVGLWLVRGRVCRSLVLACHSGFSFAGGVVIAPSPLRNRGYWDGDEGRFAFRQRRRHRGFGRLWRPQRQQPDAGFIVVKRTFDCHQDDGHRPSGGGRVGAAHHAPLFFLRISRSGFWLLHGPPCPPKESVFKALVQFGQSLSDAYASLRRSDCLQVLRRDRDVNSIASAFLKVVSPVEHLIVEKDGKFCSYSLEREDGYWAGYRELRRCA